VRLAGGDLRARAGDVGNTQEFERLARAFDAMAEGLSQREDGQRLAERALFQEKEHLAVTLRSIGDGVITTDAEGKVLLLNAMAETLTGWTQDEAAGRPLTEVFRIVNEKTRQPCANPVERVLDTGAVVELANHTALIAREAGCVVESPDGTALRHALDTTTPVAWMGYANQTLARTVRPVLRRLVAEHF